MKYISFAQPNTMDFLVKMSRGHVIVAYKVAFGHYNICCPLVALGENLHEIKIK